MLPMKSSSQTELSATENLDQKIHAGLARATSSLSIASALLSSTDWLVHLAVSPGKRLELAGLALKQLQQLLNYMSGLLPAGMRQETLEPPVKDRRFAAPEWQEWPFNLWHQLFLMQEQWWCQATHGVWGVEKHHEDVIGFAIRQWLDMYSPGNQLLTNPVVLRKTREEHGANLMRGLMNASEDWQRLLANAAPAGTEQFQVGKDVAVTRGQVVLKNQLMELIQYAPLSKSVYAEPILIVPAWIMKYYILDLSPNNSLIRYLLEQGHTVFCISWKNPGHAERNLDMDDYLHQGIFAALEAVTSITAARQVHAVGYCLGGTLLSIAAAAMARDQDQCLASMTLFAAQTDFDEPGELSLFIDESQVALLEAQMAEAGSLTAAQMVGAFQMLRSYDLLWSQIVNQYLMGERGNMNDLMAWNADATRMPARMHSQYLRRLFLNNDLSNGRYTVNGKFVSLSDITIPTFMVGTMTDHVAPWRSVYKLHYLNNAEISFVLTSGGHNAGIVSPPGHPHRHYQYLCSAAGSPSMSPDEWLSAAADTEGSWWPRWQQWLQQHSGVKRKPPSMGNANYPVISEAPGTYVLEK